MSIPELALEKSMKTIRVENTVFEQALDKVATQQIQLEIDGYDYKVL